MENVQSTPEFTLQGGPLHALGCRLGLIKSGTNTVLMGLALGCFAWSVLMALALAMGVIEKVCSLRVIGVHVRLLVVIPLFFVCETWVIPRMGMWVRNCISTGLVPKGELPALATDIRRVIRLKDSWLVEAILLLIAIALIRIDLIVNLPGRTGNWASLLSENGGNAGWIILWYSGFCLSLFRFLMFRWLWRIGLWCYFLWRVQKLKLHLIPTHPDSAAGLGGLDGVQGQFVPLVAGISALYSAQLAEDISTGTITFENIYSLIPVLLILDAALFVSPLLIFVSKLRTCRIKGMSDYMRMAYRYVDAFDRRWIQDENATGESQLGSADLQSLADLNNGVSVVRNMRLIPASHRLLMNLGIAALIPLLPLLFLKYPIEELLAKLFRMLIGF